MASTRREGHCAVCRRVSQRRERAPLCRRACQALGQAGHRREQARRRRYRRWRRVCERQRRPHPALRDRFDGDREPAVAGGAALRSVPGHGADLLDSQFHLRHCGSRPIAGALAAGIGATGPIEARRIIVEFGPEPAAFRVRGDVGAARAQASLHPLSGCNDPAGGLRRGARTDPLPCPVGGERSGRRRQSADTRCHQPRRERRACRMFRLSQRPAFRRWRSRG